MSRSNNRNLSDIANPNNNLISVSNNDVTITGAGVTQYDSADLLPSSGVTTGTQAYVAATGKLYIRGDGGWYNIATVNTSPTINSVLDSSSGTSPFTLATDGSTTVITVTATDPEGFPITFTATPNSDFNNMASIAIDSSGGRIFTVTPFSEDSATAESGTVTFKASDGINVASSISSFTLTFLKPLNSRFSDVAIAATGNGTTNQVFTDKSSIGVSATVGGADHTVNGGSVLAPLYSTFTPFNPAGYYANFDGTNYLTGPTSNSTFDFGTGEFTVECWFWIDSASDSEETMIELNTSDYGDTILINIRDSYGIAAYLNTGSVGSALTGHVPAMGSISSLASTDWTHLALVRSSDTITLYLNGRSVDSGSYSGQDFTNQTQINIGGGNNGGFHGKIFDLRVVKGSAVYTADFAPPTTFLTAISGTSLLTCRKGWFYDESTNYHEIKIDDGVSAIPADVYDTDAYDASSHGASIYFDGTQGRTLSYDNNTNYQLNSGAFTIDFWVYNSNWTAVNEQSIFEHYSSTSSGWTIYSYGRPRIDFHPGMTNNQLGTSSALNDGWVDNMWHHVVFVRNSSNSMSCFVNGKRIANTTNTSIGAHTGNLDVGGRNGTHTNPINGYISDLRIVKGTAVYDPTQTTLTVPTAPLTAITNTVFLIGSGNDASVFDKSQNKALILGGDAASSTAVSKFGSSIAFDGNGDYVATADEIPALGTGNFTIEAWVYQTASGANKQIFATTAGGSGIGSTWQSDGDITITRPGAAIDHTFSSTGVDTINTWYHYAVTRGAGTIRAYINGSEVGNVANSTDIASKKMYVGIDGDASASPFQGYIEDFRVSADVVRYPFEPRPTTLSADSDTFLLALHTSNSSTVGGSNWTVTNGGVGPAASNFGPAPGMKSFYFNDNSNSRMIFAHGGASSVYTMGNPSNGAADNFSIEFWMWIDEDAFGDNQTEIISTYGTGLAGSNNFRILNRSQDNKHRITRLNSNTDISAATTALLFPTRTWIHYYYAEEYSGTNMYYAAYANGVLITSGSRANSNSQAFDFQDIIIGARQEPQDPFKGYISNFRMQRGASAVAFPKAAYNTYDVPTASFTR